MTGRRFLYLLGLGAAFCFYLCYGEWVAGVVLAVTAGLPWLSLLLSIPAMVRFRLEVQVPRALETGEEAEAALMVTCRGCCGTGEDRSEEHTSELQSR